jgi:hypothetical protein
MVTVTDAPDQAGQVRNDFIGDSAGIAPNARSHRESAVPWKRFGLTAPGGACWTVCVTSL